MALYALGFIICFLLAGFFAASEIGFISSNRINLRHRKENKEKGAAQAYKYLLSPERFLTTVLIGVNLSNTISASLLTYILIQLDVSGSNLWTTFLFTPLVVIFADLIPKNIGRVYRESFSCRAAGAIKLFESLFYPLVWFILGINSLLRRIFFKKREKSSFFVTKQEIKFLAQQIQKEGQIDLGERRAIEEVFELKENKVKDFCLPRRKIVGFDYADSKSYLLAKIKKYQHIRYPVYQNKKIVGYINIYDLFYNPNQNWRDLIRPILKIGISQRAYEVFSALQRKKESMALVMKGNKVFGIVFLEDLTRQILTSITRSTASG